MSLVRPPARPPAAPDETLIFIHAEEYWANVSPTARDFVSECLTIDPQARPTCAQALQHKWLADERPHFVPDPESPSGGPTDLLPHIQKAFDARKTCECRLVR